MTIYVDDAIFHWKGKLWCHLFSGINDDPEELHLFAKSLGLKREWYQLASAGWAHYE